MSAQCNIKWLLFHEPIDLFVRTAQAFAQEIALLTDHRIQIEVYTIKEYSEKFKNGLKFDPLTLIKAGEVQMSQLTVGQLGKWQATDFFALDMPFLFKDHDHCARVLEGAIGENLLDRLETQTPVRGLAFTYSGGYRLIAADKEVTTVEDLKDMTLVTRTNPVFVDTAEAFGCKTMPVNVKDFSNEADEILSGNAIQTTLPRYKNETKPEVHKYVTNTKHSMYLTSIVIAADFWYSLSEEDKSAMKAAALHSARLERRWTLEDAEKIATDKKEQEKIGIVSYREFPDTETQKLKTAVSPIYDKYDQLFSPGLLDKILKA